MTGALRYDSLIQSIAYIFAQALWVEVCSAVVMVGSATGYLLSANAASLNHFIGC